MNPAQYRSEQAQSLTCASGRLQKSILSLVEASDDLLHVGQLDWIGLKRKMNFQFRNIVSLLFDDFFLIDEIFNSGILEPSDFQDLFNRNLSLSFAPRLIPIIGLLSEFLRQSGVRV